MQHVFHYTSTDTLEQIVQSLQIQFTEIRQLNDADEWIAAIDFYCKDSRTIASERLAGFIEIFELLVKMDTLPWHVACFSRRPDIDSQWRNYADNEHGVCVGFDTNHFIPQVPHSSINYGKESWFRALSLLQNRIEQTQCDTIAIGDITHFGATCKSEKWSTEEEIRYFGCVMPPELADNDCQRKLLEKMQGTRAGRRVALYPFEDRAITSVIVGDPRDIPRVHQIIESAGLPSVKVYRR
ncbi:DUF2971 domain-containing protein [Rosistilla oblonga]|uniref:DUF2971 domain-containing protein n=1 Tax=Rosistilla oblonga TaxID=2527990 RepID=UPI003A97CC96